MEIVSDPENYNLIFFSAGDVFLLDLDREKQFILVEKKGSRIYLLQRLSLNSYLTKKALLNFFLKDRNRTPTQQ